MIGRPNVIVSASMSSGGRMPSRHDLWFDDRAIGQDRDRAAFQPVGAGHGVGGRPGILPAAVHEPAV